MGAAIVSSRADIHRPPWVLISRPSTLPLKSSTRSAQRLPSPYRHYPHKLRTYGQDTEFNRAFLRDRRGREQGQHADKSDPAALRRSIDFIPNLIAVSSKSANAINGDGAGMVVKLPQNAIEWHSGA